jgi:CelD/BcsL family acetyltransferase involved in cellulose biosynthesis
MNSTAPRGTSPARLRARVVAPAELDTRDIEAWVDLESRAAEPNAFLSPHFVLPALHHIEPNAPIAVVLVERIGAGTRDTVATGVFRRTRGSKLLPLPHLAGYRSRHSYSCGLLLDRDETEASLAELLAQVRRHVRWCWGIEVPMVWADGPFARAATASSGPGAALFAGVDLEERAVLVMADAGPALLERVLGSQKKDVGRRMRRLAERGEVGWRWHRENGIPESAVETFLALEHAGWKGETGESLRSHAAHEAFFRDAVARFGREGRALFTELTLDGVPIASTSNFVSGRAGFAFKIGWHPEYKAFSPGTLNEVEFIRRSREAFPDLEYFDSGADGQSFINRLWPSRRRMASVVVPVTALARGAVATASLLREVKARVRSRRAAAPESPAGAPPEDS